VCNISILIINNYNNNNYSNNKINHNKIDINACMYVQVLVKDLVPHYPAFLAYLRESTDSGERSPGTTGKDHICLPRLHCWP
jgi:hypothetical protein